MNNKHICIIASGYPTKDDPFFAFIRPVVSEMADMGYECSVIAPQSLTNVLLGRKKRRDKKWYDKTDDGNVITIYQPMAITISNLKIAGYKISTLSYMIAAIIASRKIKGIDFVYAHFWESGLAADIIAKKNSIPFFVSTGESKINILDNIPRKSALKHLQNAKGVISVSNKNLRESKSLGLLAPETKTTVLPNAVDMKEFIKIKKQQARKELNLPENSVIALFVGYFIERKGPLRVLEAAKKMPELGLVFLGSGPQEPQGMQVLVSKSVPHHDMVKYMCAADFFVLPTLAEGCCNAIVEALVCELPVISSDKDFNEDLLDNSNSILIDPMDINELSNAMQTLVYDDEKRDSLSLGAKRKGETLGIKGRVERIMSFIEDDYE